MFGLWSFFPFPPFCCCCFCRFPSLLSYAQTVLHHLRLLDEEDEDEDPLLRFVLPPFVWSLRSTAQAPESEDVLEAEDHKLEAALGSPLGALHPQSPCPQPPLSLHP